MSSDQLAVELQEIERPSAEVLRLRRAGANASFGPDQIKVLTQGFDGPDKISRFDAAVAIVLAAIFAAWVLAYGVLLIMYGEHAGSA